MTASDHPRPRDATDSPRFAQLPTFMRLPLRDDLGALDVAIVGVPFDGGVSNRPGPRFAPNAVRAESVLCRPYNPDVRVNPYDHLRIADTGDVDTNPISLEDSYRRIREHLARVVAAGPTPVVIGGDHSISYPILQALAERHGPLNMVQFDSHSDLWDTYFGSRFAHGTMFRRALEDGLLRDGGVIQIGIRGQLFDEHDDEFGLTHGVETIRIDEALALGPRGVGERIARLEGPTYVSFDIDGVDPAYAPGTGTPAPGGLTSFDAIRMLRTTGQLEIVGADVVEISPPYDHAGMTSYLGANLIYEILCQLAVRARDR